MGCFEAFLVTCLGFVLLRTYSLVALSVSAPVMIDLPSKFAMMRQGARFQPRRTVSTQRKTLPSLCATTVRHAVQ